MYPSSKPNAGLILAISVETMSLVSSKTTKRSNAPNKLYSLLSENSFEIPNCSLGNVISDFSGICWF